MRPILITLVLLAPAQLSELDTTQAALHQTKVQLLQVQEQLAACQIRQQTVVLSDAQAQLEARFRAVLKPAEGAVFNWTTLSFDQ